MCVAWPVAATLIVSDDVCTVECYGPAGQTTAIIFTAYRQDRCEGATASETTL